MNILKNLSIKARMKITFFSILVLFVVYGLFTVKQLDEAKNVYDRSIDVTNSALKIDLGIIQINKCILSAMQAKTDKDAEKAIEEEKRYEKKVDYNLEKIKEYTKTDSEKKVIAKIEKKFNEWKIVREKINKIALSGGEKRLSLLIQNQNNKLVDKLERETQNLTSHTTEVADNYILAASESHYTILKNSIIIIVLLVSIIAILAYLAVVSMLSNVTELKDVMYKITNSGKLVKAKLKGKNEIIEMAAYFNNLVDKLQHQFWVRDGQNSLNQELSGDLEYEDIFSRSVIFLSRYTKAYSAAIYSFDKEENRCNMQASYAYSKEKLKNLSFELGESLIGTGCIGKKTNTDGNTFK